MADEEKTAGLVTSGPLAVIAPPYVELRSTQREGVLNILIVDWRDWGEPQTIEEFQSPECVAIRERVARERAAGQPTVPATDDPEPVPEPEHAPEGVRVKSKRHR